MKIERKVNLGGYENMTFTSSEHNTVQDCARDIIGQMIPMVRAYPILNQKVAEIKVAYGV